MSFHSKQSTFSTTGSTNISLMMVLLSLGLSLLSAPQAAAANAEKAYVPPLAAMPMNHIVQNELVPQIDYLFQKLRKEKTTLALDGEPAFNGKDKFLPGKIAAGLGHLLLNMPANDPKRAQYLSDYRDIADMTIDMDNHTWGIYYYILTLYQLKKAGMLEQAVTPQTLALLKKKLDWKTFVTTPDFKLINLPTNYYGVAFSIARLRMLMGWEDEADSKILLDKMLRHYETYSGTFGFSDETDGEGRFDRYSILLIAEICQRFMETGLTVTPELKGLLRKATDVALNMANTSGDGFSYGRSLGPYGETAALEILAVSAELNVLTAEEKQYAYAYATTIVAKYADFWYDPAIHSVDMWGKGRRTDAYRGKHRILGENFSLLHQLIYTNEIWNKIGFADQAPKKDFQAWLDKTRAPFTMTWFAKGEYDRALATFRDKNHVFNLLMVNGGSSQHDNSPYYPLPFSPNMIAGVADSGAGHPQLLPKFTMADGSELLGTAYIKNIRVKKDGATQRIDYQQDALTRLGAKGPIKDTRIQLETSYALASGVITRTDKYTAKQPQAIDKVSLEFGSFSSDASIVGNKVKFAKGTVDAFEVSGLTSCTVEKTNGNPDFQAPTGPMQTHVQCIATKLTLKDPLIIKWTLRYH